MQLIHDSRDPAYRTPTGAQPCGSSVRLRLRVAGEIPQALHLRAWFGKESFIPMLPVPDNAGLFEAMLTLPETPCLLWYDFQAWVGGQFFWYGNAEDGLGGVGAPVQGSARSFQITVYDPAFMPPEWTRGAVFYQIFPDRFARGDAAPTPPPLEGRTYHDNWNDLPGLVVDPETGDNTAHDFFGGTLRGIREKLPYIATLGVTALYLNPIFHAQTNHRFDTTDWKAIDPLLGTEADFTALCADAAAAGIHIVLDGVFSHSGSENPYFLHARTVPDSPYRNWYQFEHWPDMYKSWWGFKTLPDLNKHQPDVIKYFLTDDDAVVRHWPRAGAAGWRIDVADELPVEYLKLLRHTVKDIKPDALIIGEVWEDASNKLSYNQMRCYCLGDMLDSVMNYPLRDAAIGFLTGSHDAADFKRRMDSLYENYPPPFAHALLNLLGSHDRPRVLNVLVGADGDDLPRQKRAKLKLTPSQRTLGRKRLTLLLHLIVAMPGMPCVYYGDEVGLEGAGDPYNRATFPWGNEDQAITDLFRSVLNKKRMPALSDGALAIQAANSDVLAICRRSPHQTYVVVVNRSETPQAVKAFGREILLNAYGIETWEENEDG